MKNQRFATKALIVNDGKVLLIKRSDKEEVYTGLWDIPGGRLKLGEPPHDGLKREAVEEIGIEVEIQKPWHVWDFTTDKGETQVIGITFICSIKPGAIKLSEEHTEYLWATLNEVTILPMDKYLRKEIIDYFETLTTPGMNQV